MGVDRSVAGRGYGTDLVIDAARRALIAARTATGSSLLVVDAKSDALIGFYEGLGFKGLPDQPRRLVFPMRKIEQLFANDASEGLPR
jgi:ribosomal protein S18 acetylase RimI-like enzyme